MEPPTIRYGTEKLPMHEFAQYLLMKADLKEAEYSTQDFVEALYSVSLDDITQEDCRIGLIQERTILEQLASQDNKVTIENYCPNKKGLEAFIDATSKQFEAERLELIKK